MSTIKTDHVIEIFPLINCLQDMHIEIITKIICHTDVYEVLFYCMIHPGLNLLPGSMYKWTLIWIRNLFLNSTKNRFITVAQHILYILYSVFRKLKTYKNIVVRYLIAKETAMYSNKKIHYQAHAWFCNIDSWFIQINVICNKLPCLGINLYQGWSKSIK